MSDEQKVVTVFRTTQPLQIAMVKSALRQAGIPFSAVNDVVSSVMPYDGMLVVGFEVMERHAERALDAIRDLGFDRSTASLHPRTPSGEASADKLPRPRRREAGLIRSQMKMELRIPPADAITRLSAVGKEQGLSPSSAVAEGVEGFFVQGEGTEFRLYPRRSPLAPMVRAGAKPPAFCTVNAEPYRSGSLITARFNTPLLLKVGIALFLLSSAAAVILLAAAAVWPAWVHLVESPTSIVLSAAWVGGPVLPLIAKFRQNRLEGRARGFLEDVFGDEIVSAPDEG